MWITLPPVMHKLFIDEVYWSGWDGLLERLSALCPDAELYAVSQDWIESPAGTLVLKARGARGDLVVSFDGSQPDR